MAAREIADLRVRDRDERQHEGISKPSFRAVAIPCPVVEEQRAIAAVLSDMDTDIAALEAKLAKATQIKQGMVQELLTGRIRLPVGKATK